MGRRVVEDLARFEHVPGFAAQCWAAWSILAAVCDEARLPLERLTKTTVYLRHAADLWIYEEIREAFFSGIGRDLPAAEFFGDPGPGRCPRARPDRGDGGGEVGTASVERTLPSMRFGAVANRSAHKPRSLGME
jgi:hypothetical protein